MQKNYWHCRQQRRTFFRVVGKNAEKLSALWVTTQENGHNAEQYYFLVSLSLLLQGQFT
jgi:hypothetical protein